MCLYVALSVCLFVSFVRDGRICKIHFGVVGEVQWSVGASAKYQITFSMCLT